MEGALLAPLIVIGGALFVLAWVALIKTLRQAKRARGPWAGRGADALARAAAALEARGGGDLTKDGAFELVVGGRPLRAFGARPNKGRNVVVGLGASAGVGVVAGSPFRGAARPALDVLPHFVLREETGFDRLGKRLGLNLEVQTGDAGFDARVYVEGAGAREEVAAVLSDERVRRGALALLDAGGTQIAFAEGPDAVAVLWPAHLKAAISPESLRASAAHLLAIVDGLPPLRGVHAEAPRPGAPRLALAYLVLGGAALAAAGAAFAAWPPLGRAMVAPAALLAWLGTALFVALAGAREKGRPDALARVCVAALGAAMLGPGLAVGALVFANAWQDASAVEHAVDVERAYFGAPRRGGRRYYVRVASRGPGEGPLVIEVPRERFEALGASKRALVRAGAGRLGYEWVRSVEAL